MIKKRNVLLISISLISCGLVAVNLLSLHKDALIQRVKSDDYTLTINKNNPLQGGDVLTPGGTNIHFDEYGVDETVADGLLTLASYGSICLQTYISGISSVEVTSETGDGKSFFLSIGATPNSAEYTTESFNGHGSVDLIDGYGTGCYFFSIHNKNETPLVIKSISINYTCQDNEAYLRNLVDNHLSSPLEVEYTGHPYNPYDGYEIDPSLIPSDRHLIATMGEDDYPTSPGHYTYGYEVYDVDNLGQPRKLLYTRTKSFKIFGSFSTRKVITFHIPDENGKEKLVLQEVDGSNYDITQIPTECLPYSWDSPYNNFSQIGDEHYYPVFRVSGLSANKEGDGCYPVHLNYSYAERGFTMPEPQMKPGYKFGGWYTDANLTKPFDEQDVYPGNITLYAKCLETDLDVKRVYYHYQDGSLADRIDYLYSDDSKLTLPDASSFMDVPSSSSAGFWDIFCGTTNTGIYRQSIDSSSTVGDLIKYSDFTGHDGDIHAYIANIKEIPNLLWTYDLFSQDSDGNDVFQHTLMANKFKRNDDFVIPGYGVKQRENGQYHYQSDGFTIDRTGQFFMTDEKAASVIDGGTLKTIASYGYGNIEMRKPLSGVLRHESVQKVGRRAFFNRYGLKGTYFPRNATDFEIEAYANVVFNRVLTLPKNLNRIGDRCFLGAENIDVVCLPRSIKHIGQNAFAYGIYNPETRIFEHISNRDSAANNPITFLYEGSETDFNILDEVTKAAITNNASRIVYNYSYQTYYGRG